MSLYACQRCKAVENTALGQYWMEDEKLCSECATGEWHGRFPKRNAIEAGYWTDGHFIYSPDEVSEKNGQMVWTYNPAFEMKGTAQ